MQVASYQLQVAEMSFMNLAPASVATLVASHTSGSKTLFNKQQVLIRVNPCLKAVFICVLLQKFIT